MPVEMAVNPKATLVAKEAMAWEIFAVWVMAEEEEAVLRPPRLAMALGAMTVAIAQPRLPVPVQARHLIPLCSVVPAVVVVRQAVRAARLSRSMRPRQSF